MPRTTSKGQSLNSVSKEIKEYLASIEGIVKARYSREFLQDPIFNNYIRKKLVSIATALEEAEEQASLPFKELREEEKILYTTLKGN